MPRGERAGTRPAPTVWCGWLGFWVVGLGRHEACPYGVVWVVGIGWWDWAGTRPAPTVRCGWLGLGGGTGQARGLPLRCGVGGWDWVAGLGRHEACPYGVVWVVGIGWWDWAGTRPAPTVWCGWLGLGGGTGQARGLPLRCGVGGWACWVGLGRHKACPYCGGGGWPGRAAGDMFFDLRWVEDIVGNRV